MIEPEKTYEPEYPRWMPLSLAAWYVSMNDKKLKQKAQDSTCVIKGSPDPDTKNGKWIFDRYSLDAYREAQLAGSNLKYLEIKQKTVEILGSLN